MKRLVLNANSEDIFHFNEHYKDMVKDFQSLAKCSSQNERNVVHNFLRPWSLFKICNIFAICVLVLDRPS